MERVVTLLLDISKWKRHFTHPNRSALMDMKLKVHKQLKILLLQDACTRNSLTFVNYFITSSVIAQKVTFSFVVAESE